MAQFVTRLDDSLADRVDSLVAAGVLASRSEAVRLGLEKLADELERRELGRAIVDAYTRQPQTEAELAWTDEAARRMIADEPW
jgi:Arc/MetJ-type ribon-helix-helix transcriptional regulator